MSSPYRQIHLDFHTSPAIRDVGVLFDPEAFARTLSAAQVESVNLFAKCHHGYFYYPTKVGEMHPGLSFDLLGAQVKACRRQGIGVVIYTCAGWNERASELYPQWMQLDREGRLGCVAPFSSDYYKWHNMCVGHPEYRQYLMKEIEEEIRLFSPDAVWVDIVTSNGCVCPSCRRDMERRGMEPRDPEQVQRHDRINEIGFMREIREFVRGVNPHVKLYFNGGPAEPDNSDDPALSNNRKCEQMDYVDIESLPGGYWGYTHFPICVNHLNHTGKDLTMMNGRFHLSWGDFGSLRNLEALEYECFRGLANGTHVCIGDQMHPRGILEPAVYERIGQVFKKIKDREPWLESTRKCVQIGVYLSNPVTHPPGLPEEGAYRIFTELHQPIDFLDFENDVEGYDLLVLPDQVELDQAAAQRIQRHIDAGKAVLVTGYSGQERGTGRPLLDMGVKMMGKAEYAPRYLRLDPKAFPRIPSMDYVFYEPGFRATAGDETQVLAQVVNSYFNRTYNRFCSHRQSPADALSEEAAVLRRGNTVYVAQPLFSEYARHGNRLCKDMMAHLLELLLPEPLIKADLPNYAEVYLRRQNNDLVLHILNYILQKKSRDMDTIEEITPLYRRHIKVKSSTVPQAVRRVPDGIPLPYTYSDGYIDIYFEQIEGYETVHIVR